MLKRQRVDVSGMFVSFAIVLMAMVLLFLTGCATSETASVQSAPFSYSQGSENQEQVPYIHASVHVLFRDVPMQGAVKQFTRALGNALNKISTVGGLTAIGTSPERMFSRLEDGKRAHLAFPLRIPLVSGRNTDVEVTGGDIEAMVRKALEKADIEDQVEGITVGSFSMHIKSTMAEDDEG